VTQEGGTLSTKVEGKLSGKKDTEIPKLIEALNGKKKRTRGGKITTGHRKLCLKGG